MHEFHLLEDILKKIEAVARENRADHVKRVAIWLGALSHISADHFREHFEQATQDHVAQNAELDIEVSTDESDPKAQEIVLKSIDI